MPDKPWKRAERRVARLLGGRRVSKRSLGEGGPDVEAGRLEVEVKYRSSVPAWLMVTADWAAECRRRGKVAVKVIRFRGKPGGLAILDLETFRQLAERAGWVLSDVGDLAGSAERGERPDSAG